jgi:hypothetical protein
MTETGDSFAAGLVNRRTALEKRKNMPPTAIDEHPFDDDFPEEGELEEREVLRPHSPPEAAAPAAPVPTPGVTARGKKIGRPRGRKTAKPAEAATAPAEPVPQASLVEDDVAEAGEGISPRDPLVLWPKILEKARSEGVPAELIQLRIERAAIGPAPTEFLAVDTIDGELVSGDESGNAGQMLVTYVTEVIHLARKTAARYKISAMYKVKQAGSFKVMHMKLDHPDEIRALKMRKADFMNQQMITGRPPMSPPNYRPPPPMPGMGAMPSYPSVTPTLPAPPNQTVPPTAMDQLEQWRKWEEFRQQLIMANQPAPPSMPMPVFQPPAPVIQQLPPAAPAMSKEDEELIFEARMARFIKAGGYVLPSETPAAKPADIKDRAAGFKEIIAAFKELESFKTQIQEAVGGGGTGETEEEPAAAENPIDKITFMPIPIGGGRVVQLPRNTKGTADFIQQWLGSNPQMTMELGVQAMGGIAQALDKTSFGKVLSDLVARGGPPAQIAQAAQAAGIQGTGPLNGSTPATQRIRSPQA